MARKYPGLTAGLIDAEAGAVGAAVDLEIAAQVHVAERHPVHAAGRDDIAAASESLREHVLVKRVQPLRGWDTTDSRKLDRQPDDVVGAEARIDGSKPQEALRHQAGARQQHERQRDLADDQRRAKSFLSAEDRTSTRQ